MEFYSYAYGLEEEDGEIFFVFRDFPEIISTVQKSVYDKWSEEERQAHAEDAVITALQASIATRAEIPSGDDADKIASQRFVHLSPLHAMKLELFKVYERNCKSVSEFARKIEKQDTAARRLLNLRHRSSLDEVVEAAAHFGLIFRHGWGTRQETAQASEPSLRKPQVA